MDKYETFKKATFELLQASGQTSVYSSLQEIATMIESGEADPQKETAMTVQEFNKLTYKERAALYQDNPTEYARIVGGGK